MERGAGEKAQGFTALCIKAGADHARRGGKADRFEMAQQGMDGERPRAGLPMHDIAAAHDHGATAAAEGDFGVGRRGVLRGGKDTASLLLLWEKVDRASARDG